VARLEDLTRGAAVKGVRPDGLVTVVDARWYGSTAVELTFKDLAGALGSELIYRDREPTLEIVTAGRPWEPVGRWGLAEIERVFVLWHRFRAEEFGRDELRRRLIPLQARLGRLLDRRQENPDRKAAALCRELTKWWPALWTFARVEGVEPTNNVSEQTLRPSVLWRKGSFGSDSAAGSRFAERLLTVVASCRQQGRPLLGFLVAANEAALQGTAAPSLLASRPG
jgi:transposase